MQVHPGGIDYAILLIYFACVIGIGWALTRDPKRSTDFVLSGRSVPAWVTGLALLSATFGAPALRRLASPGPAGTSLRPVFSGTKRPSKPARTRDPL
jgi:SSS family solute:Na+ symporter